MSASYLPLNNDCESRYRCLAKSSDILIYIFSIGIIICCSRPPSTPNSLPKGTYTPQRCSLFFYSSLSLCSAKIRNMKSANISNADNPKPLLQSFQRLRNLCISSVGCDAAAAYHGSETLIKAEQRSYCVGMTRYSKCVGLSESGNN
jgi:hypothetical protein